MDYAVAVALEGVAIRMIRFGKGAAEALLYREAQARQHGRSGRLLCGISPRAEIAVWPTAPVLLRSGSRSLRASAGFLGASMRAKSTVA